MTTPVVPAALAATPPPPAPSVEYPATQLPAESAKAYEAFRMYCEMGTERSLRAVGKKLGKSRQMLDRYAAKFQWQARLRTWLAEQAEAQRQATAQAALETARLWQQRRDEVAATAWDISAGLLARAKEMLLWPLSRREVVEHNAAGEAVISNIYPVKWSQSDIAQIVKVGDQLARLATGQPIGKLALTDANGGDLPLIPPAAPAPRLTIIIEKVTKEAAGKPTGTGVADETGEFVPAAASATGAGQTHFARS